VALRRLGDLLHRHGFVMVRGGGGDRQLSQTVGALLGGVRSTFWGPSWSVKSSPNPTNLSLTGHELYPHTDFTWSCDPPGLQLLHCVHFAEVNESGVVGEAAAEAATDATTETKAGEAKAGEAKADMAAKALVGAANTAGSHVGAATTAATTGDARHHRCNTDDAQAGEISEGLSVLVDGLSVARQLREQDPRSYELLTTVELPFSFFSQDNMFFTHGRIIEVEDSSSGGSGNSGSGGSNNSSRRLPLRNDTAKEEDNVRLVRYNAANMAPLDVHPSLVPEMAHAVRQFAALTRDPANQLRFRLEEGDMVIFNNHRLLHGRE
jgi:hypothetical protein